MSSDRPGRRNARRRVDTPAPRASAPMAMSWRRSGSISPRCSGRSCGNPRRLLAVQRLDDLDGVDDVIDRDGGGVELNHHTAEHCVDLGETHTV
jgi:hypothetical protein